MRRLIIVLAIIAALLLISPLLTGQMAEKELKAASEKLSTQMGAVQLVETDFDRGWFESETNHEFVIDNAMLGGSTDEETTTGLKTHTEIMHGPMIIGGDDPNLPAVSAALAISKTTFTYDAKNGDEPFDIPGALYNRIALNGSGTLWGVFDPIEDQISNSSGDDAEIKWGGGGFETSYNAAQTELDSTMATEPLSIIASDGSLNVGKISGNSVASKASFGFWTGTGSATIESMSFAGDDGQSMTMQDLQMDATSELVGEDRVSGSFVLSVAELDAPGFNNSSIKFPFEMSNFDAEAVGRMQAVADAQKGNPEDATLMMLEMQEVGMLLVQRGFGIAIPGFSMATEHGDANLDISIEVPESDAAGQAATMAALIGATGSAQLRIDRSLLDFFAKDNPQLLQQAAGMIQLGYLAEDGDALIMNAGYEGGLLTVNGLPIPLPIPGG